MAGQSVAETLARLYRLHASGIKLDLETMRALLGQLGNPERALCSIHVAGTNGKGSVCAMIESMLRAAGLKTALYTSPHLSTFNERLRVGGQCIRDSDLAALIPEVEAAARAVAASAGLREPTFFEFTTALAFEHFRRSSTDVAVLETGMGGRLDATNVVVPAVSVVTGVALEHTAYLGPDVISIAREKLGIAKPGVPLVVGPLPAEVMAEAGAIARGLGSRLVEAERVVSAERVSTTLAGQRLRLAVAGEPMGTALLPLLGRHQIENCALALAALAEYAAASGLELEPAAIRAGLAAVYWPARFQVIRESPVPLVVDCAHNPEAASVLADTFDDVLGSRKIALVVGMCSDKDLAGFLTSFGKRIGRCWAVPLRTERSLQPEVVVETATRLGWDARKSDLPSAINAASEWAEAEAGIVCVAGSIFLAGEALELLCGPDPVCSAACCTAVRSVPRRGRDI